MTRDLAHLFLTTEPPRSPSSWEGGRACGLLCITASPLSVADRALPAAAQAHRLSASKNCAAHPEPPNNRRDRALRCMRVCNHRHFMVSFAAEGHDPVAQWNRALPCGGRGRAFESPQGRHHVGGRSRRSALGRPSLRAQREAPGRSARRMTGAYASTGR